MIKLLKFSDLEIKAFRNEYGTGAVRLYVSHNGHPFNAVTLRFFLKNPARCLRAFLQEGAARHSRKDRRARTSNSPPG